MKLNKKLGSALIILSIILVSLVSFVGIYVQNKANMEGLVEQYTLGSDLNGYVKVIFAVDDTVNTTYYDKDGNKVAEKTEDGTEKQVPVNPEENLTRENYLAARKIIEERLEQVRASDYILKQDEETGKIELYLPDDDYINLSVSAVYTTGKFTAEDDEGNVLLDSSDIKEARAMYERTETSIIPRLIITLNDEAEEKIKNINDNYLNAVEVDEEGNATTKSLSLKLDDTSLGTLSDAITNKTISIDQSINEAGYYAIFLNSKPLPVTYEVPTQTKYINSDITDEVIVTIGLAVAIIIIVALVLLIVKYKKNGLLASISYIGYVALLLLIIRYTQVPVSIEGAFGILINFVLNYIFLANLLKVMKEENAEIKVAYHKEILAMLWVLIPMIILGIIFALASWLTIYSFGSVIFWGILLMFAYHFAITRTLFICSTKKE